jgi:putative oxidoreductase
MLASIFVLQGFDAMVNPERVSSRAEPVVQPLAERVPLMPSETEQAVRINGAVQFAGGLLLGMGRLPRLSALAIAATLVPTTLAGHRFWEIEDKQERAAQRIHFLKNLAILGGLLLAAVDTAGNPSLAWRAQHAVESARRDRTRARQIAEASAQAGYKVGFKAGAKASRRASGQSARKASAPARRKASAPARRKASAPARRKASAPAGRKASA